MDVLVDGGSGDVFVDGSSGLSGRTSRSATLTPVHFATRFLESVKELTNQTPPNPSFKSGTSNIFANCSMAFSPLLDPAANVG